MKIGYIENGLKAQNPIRYMVVDSDDPKREHIVSSYAQAEKTAEMLNKKAGRDRYFALSIGLEENPADEIFARKPTKAERQSSGTLRSRGFNKYPDKEGYKKVYKPYGIDGAGYYWVKNEK